MKIQVHINKKTVSINDRAFNYGDGLFETILVKNNKPKLLNQHIKRLFVGCKRLSIKLPGIKLIKDSIQKAIGSTNECIIKIIYTRGISGHGYGYDSDITPQLYVIKKKKKLHVSKKFISLGYSKHVLSDNSYLSRIKHMNRLEQVLGYVNKDDNTFDNHIMTNGNREIIECINSNIFFYKYTNVLVIYTPILNDSGVDGILKQEIIKTFQKKKVKVKNKNIKRADIKLYDGCFICNSINGVQFVNKISNKTLNHIEYLEELLDKYIYE